MYITKRYYTYKEEDKLIVIHDDSPKLIQQTFDSMNRINDSHFLQTINLFSLDRKFESYTLSLDLKATQVK